MTDRLSLYNGALQVAGERDLASLTENCPPRRYLDSVWNRGAVDYVLGAGQWKFATRSVELLADTTVEPSFGFAYAYEIPTDHIRTVALCSDEFFKCPILQYNKEQNYIFTDLEPIYLRYVSNHADYGSDYTLWPADFVEYVHAYLAFKISKKLNQSNEDQQSLFSLAKRLLSDAKSSDAMEGPTVFPPAGRLVRARRGGSSGTQDRGSRNQLIG